MSDYLCPKCKTNALIDDSKSTFFCCKCNEEIYLEQDQSIEVDEE